MNDPTVPDPNQPIATDPTLVGSPPQENSQTKTGDRPAFLTVEESAPLPQHDTTILSEPEIGTPQTFVVSENNGSSGGNAKKIAAIFGILLLVGATGAGVFLAGRQQLEPAAAWDCAKYNFTVTQTGAVNVNNGSSRNEPPQKAKVKINSSEVATLDVPALSPGQSVKLGDVSVPTNGSFTWEVTGTVDCKDGGSYQGSQVSASCGSIKAFDSNWQQLSASALNSLTPGSTVRFSVLGTTTSGNLDKARFTINGTQRAEVTAKRPSTDEFYDEYLIPTGVTSFNVTAQVHHQQTGNWY